MKKVIIVGGGAAGMAAAVFAGERGANVQLFEHNEKLGKKLFITGKGRCNFTNVCSENELLENVVSNARFLYSAFSDFNSQDAVDFFEGAGVKTKVERGRRAFPLSDHSSDIIRAMEKKMQLLGTKVSLRTRVEELIIEENKAVGVVLSGGEKVYADAVIVATGGLSYPSTGSTGDGYEFAKEAGLKVTECRPALVPLQTKEPYVKELQGLSLKNVTLTIKQGKKELYSAFGEMLFTHFGVSGPLVISASSKIGKKLEKGPLQAYIDLKPALTQEQLDARILKEFGENKNKQFKNVIASLFPAKLTPVMLELGDIDPFAPVNEVTKGKRRQFVELIKKFPFTITDLRPYSEAVVTQGGVSVREINPATMESKKIKGLYFIGEVLDVDAYTGGYNLQIAWSTAHKAAQALAAQEEE